MIERKKALNSLSTQTKELDALLARIRAEWDDYDPHGKLVRNELITRAQDITSYIERRLIQLLALSCSEDGTK